MSDEVPFLAVRFRLRLTMDFDPQASLGDLLDGPIPPEECEIDPTGVGSIEYAHISGAEVNEIRAFFESNAKVADYGIIRDWSEIYPELLALAVEMKADGHSTDDVLLALRRNCPSVVQSIKAIRSAYGMSLSEAKQLVHQSAAWTDRREEFDRLHDAAEQSVDELPSEN